MNLIKKIRDPRKALVGLGLVIVLVAMWLFIPRPQTSLIIVNGQEYQLLSYGSAEPQLSNGTTLEAYVLTVTYDEPEKGLTRGTIMVPKFAIKYDRKLPRNTVIWDWPVFLEGKTYASARWNPGHAVPAYDNPPLVPEAPLTRTQ